MVTKNKFHKTVFDPKLVVLQIICLQCFYYLFMGFTMAIFHGNRCVAVLQAMLRTPCTNTGNAQFSANEMPRAAVFFSFSFSFAFQDKPQALLYRPISQYGFGDRVS
jgi:hypothetical protein